MGLYTNDSEQQWFNRMGFWNCKSVAELPKPDGTYQQANVNGILYVSNGSTWSQVGSGGSLGTFATSAALQSAYPASGNLGKTAQVGAGPYDTYTSNGNIWYKIADVSNVGNALSYEYSSGTIRQRSGIKKSRITRDETAWLAMPTAPSNSNAAWSVTTDTKNLFTRASSQGINILTAAYAEIDWTVNLAMPSDGYLLAPVWLEDYSTAGYSPAIIIILTNSSGTIKFKYTGGALIPGAWNMLPIWDPSSAAKAITSPSLCEINSMTAGFSFAAGNITTFAINPTNFPAGGYLALGTIVSPSKVKPMIVLTNDVTATLDTFTTGIVPIMENAGFRMGLRIGGFSESSYSSGNITPLKAAYLNGHDVYNGSWSRTSLTSSTTEAGFASEILGCHNRAIDLGFSRGMQWFSSSGNALPSTNVCRKLAPLLGLRTLKASRGSTFNICTGRGIDDQLALGVTGMGGSSAVRQIGTGSNGASSFTVTNNTGLSNGQTIFSASGFPTGITVSSITGTGPYTVNITGGTLNATFTSQDVFFGSSTTATGTSGNNYFTAASPTGLYIGQQIVSATGTQTTGIPANTYITDIIGTTIYINNNLTANLTAQPIAKISGITQYTATMNALLYLGGVLVYFIHDLPFAANITLGSSTYTTVEDFTAIVAQWKTQSDAGLLDVVTPTTLDAILAGEL